MKTIEATLTDLDLDLYPRLLEQDQAHLARSQAKATRHRQAQRTQRETALRQARQRALAETRTGNHLVLAAATLFATLVLWAWTLAVLV